MSSKIFYTYSFHGCPFFLNFFYAIISKVQNNWRNRIRMTSKFTEEYCQQVKRCIEIALKCLEVDKNNRPAIGDIISMLTETETVEQQEDEDNYVFCFSIYTVLNFYFNDFFINSSGTE